jgi:hypothetical protein
VWLSGSRRLGRSWERVGGASSDGGGADPAAGLAGCGGWRLA